MERCTCRTRSRFCPTAPAGSARCVRCGEIVEMGGTAVLLRADPLAGAAELTAT